MLSDEAKKSINKYKSYSGFMSSMYKNPNVMSKRRLSFFRWLVDLQGTIGPKVEGTIKEEIELGGIKTLSLIHI